MAVEDKTPLVPDTEFLTEDGFTWCSYSPTKTGLQLIRLDDPKTGLILTTTIANPEKRTAAHRAWAGARHSRAPGTPWEIMYEMGERGVDPDQKLDEMFANYGHKSVGDMARLEMASHAMPMHACWALFNEASLNGGQEKSSRYQSKFGQALLHPIGNYLSDTFPQADLPRVEKQYQTFGNEALAYYAELKGLLMDAFTAYYQPGDKQQSALESRVLDCVRFFLPFGMQSGLSIDTSARDFSRIISELKASPVNFYRQMGAQMERLFTPAKEIEDALKFKAEAPSLIRHSEEAPLVNNNIAALHQFVKERTDFLDKVSLNTEFRGRVGQNVMLLSCEFTPADRMVAQYLMTIWPGINDRDELLEWVSTQKGNTKKEISKIIFAGHNHNHELPLWAGASETTLVLESFLGEVRDWNRHRAWSRFTPIPLVFGEKWTAHTAHQIINRGFGLPLYLSEITEFSDLVENFEKKLDSYYGKLKLFVGDMEERYGNTIDYSFVINLLLLAHQLDIWMHGNPKQALYMPHLRVRPGGHINYRALAYDANQLLASSDPYLEGMRLDKKPDPKSREEFFNRS